MSNKCGNAKPRIYYSAVVVSFSSVLNVNSCLELINYKWV